MSKGRLKEKQILVVIKEPGREPRVEPFFDNTLEAFQKAVGGHIEVVSPYYDDMAVICNEEGRLLGLPYNTTVCGLDFCGTLVVAGVKGEEFSSLPSVRTAFALRMMR